MDEVLQTASKYWSKYLEAVNQGDPRTEGWLLMDGPWTTWGITLAYLLTIFVGMKMMAKREAFSLKPVIIFYNAAMVVLNAHIAFELLHSAYKLNYIQQWCTDTIVDEKDLNEDQLRIAAALWWYYVSKAIEFLDTIFFVLRKRNRQITFLHIYHHSTMFPIWWMGVKWAPGGETYFGPSLNAIVHVVMYTYYALSAAGIRVTWKKYMTMMQLAQFFTVFIKTVVAINEVDEGRCTFPKWMGYCLLAYLVSMITLFSMFFIKTYVSGPAASSSSSSASKKSVKDTPVKRAKRMD